MAVLDISMITQLGYPPPFPRRSHPAQSIEERLGEKGGAFFNGKEGRDDFRTIITPHPGDNMHIG